MNGVSRGRLRAARMGPGDSVLDVVDYLRGEGFSSVSRANDIIRWNDWSFYAEPGSVIMTGVPARWIIPFSTAWIRFAGAVRRNNPLDESSVITYMAALRLMRNVGALAESTEVLDFLHLFVGVESMDRIISIRGKEKLS